MLWPHTKTIVVFKKTIKYSHLHSLNLVLALNRNSARLAQDNSSQL